MGDGFDFMEGTLFTDFERWEVLVKDQRRIGVRYQSMASNVLLTRMLVDQEPEVYRAESRIRLDPKTDNWEVNQFRDQNLDRAQIMHRDSVRFPTRSMPSFGDILMVMKAVEAAEEQFTYWRLSEVSREAQEPIINQPDEPNAWVKRVGHFEELPIPLGITLKAERYEAWADGLLVATHWVNKRKEVVSTNWGDSLIAYRVPGSASEAGWLSLSGLDEGVVSFMSHGFDTNG